jgi:spore coat protein SA
MKLNARQVTNIRILIVAPEQIPVPPILGGSVEITVLAVAKKLAGQHSVTVVSRSHSRYPRQSFISGVKINRVPAGSPMKYLENVERFLAGKHYDVIQVDNRPRFVAPLKKMFPDTLVTLFLHSLTFVSRPYAGPPIARQGLAAADLILANSTSLKKQLSLRFPDTADKIRKVWLGVDTARFSPAGREKSRRSFTLLFAGRLIPRKGVPVLLKAARLVRSRSHRPVKVIIAGGAQKSGYGTRMRSMARKMGVHARFLGTVPHSRIHRIYRQADVFVCPSQKHEAFGLVNVEAMSSGLPVVASAIGGITEVVKDNCNGYLIRRYRRPQAFADAITRLVHNPALLRTMKRQAREDCLERFSWTATARRLSELYSSKSLQADS